MPPPTTAPARATKTARWATTMTRWAIRFASTGKRVGTRAVKRWQFVSFAGPKGAESRGIVDLLAIRRNHQPVPGFQLGDLFEIILVQIKGGSARWPSVNDEQRLRAVKKRYGAKDVVLASWKKDAEPHFYVLDGVAKVRRGAWGRTHPSAIFGSRITRRPRNEL